MSQSAFWMKQFGISELVGKTGDTAQKAAARGVIGFDSAMNSVFRNTSSYPRHMQAGTASNMIYSALRFGV